MPKKQETQSTINEIKNNKRERVRSNQDVDLQTLTPKNTSER